MQSSSLRLLAGVDAAVGGGGAGEVLGDDGLRRLDAALLQLQLVRLNRVQKVVVVPQRRVLKGGPSMYDIQNIFRIFDPPICNCYWHSCSCIDLSQCGRHISMVPCAARRTAGRALRRWAAGPRCSRSSSRGASPARAKRLLVHHCE